MSDVLGLLEGCCCLGRCSAWPWTGQPHPKPPDPAAARGAASCSSCQCSVVHRNSELPASSSHMCGRNALLTTAPPRFLQVAPVSTLFQKHLGSLVDKRPFKRFQPKFRSVFSLAAGRVWRAPCSRRTSAPCWTSRRAWRRWCHPWQRQRDWKVRRGAGSWVPPQGGYWRASRLAG